MIYFLTAMFHEASALVELYQLKKETDIRPFQVFASEGVRLVVSGTGAVNAPAAAAFLCGVYPPAEGDLFVNTGLCAGDPAKYGIGDLVVANRLLDETSGRFFYPDMLFRHPFMEDGLCSSPIVKTDANALSCHTFGLADMEGAFVFQAASHFFSADRIIIIKTVSDYFEPGRVTKDDIRRLLRGNAPPLQRWLGDVHGLTMERVATLAGCKYTAREQKAMADVAGHLLLTASMQITLKKYVKYKKLQRNYVGTESDEGLSILLEHYARLSCRDKAEGKRLYAELLQRLME